tara:strand:- start:491 stop:1018 length:528 start_codon:yes stop_codon:yes gene_type:complete
MGSTLNVDTIQGSASATSVDLSGVTNLKMPAGSVIQTVTTGTIARTTQSASSFTATNYTLSITPKFATSKIKFTYTNHVRVYGSGTPIRGGIQVKRQVTGGSLTTVWNTNDSGETIQVRNADNEHDTLAAICFIDSPSTTDATTYTVFTRILTGTSLYTFEDAFGGAVILEEIAQ